MTRLFKGIFWITNIDDIEDNDMFFYIPVDLSGNIDDSADRTKLNSKKHDNYNHKKTWESLNTKETRNKEFDYYPRGRVEISNGKAIIFATPRICTDNIIDLIKRRYSLSEENGIHTVTVIPDHSEHYKCYLDRC